MKISPSIEAPFRLKKYYLIYGGAGAILFYFVLFSFLISSEREALYSQYMKTVSQNAKNLYLDVERDFFQPRNKTIKDIDGLSPEDKKELRNEIDHIVNRDFSLAQVKLFRKDGMTLYDHNHPENEGQFYKSRYEEAFLGAIKGKRAIKIEHENNGKRLIEAYIPIFEKNGRKTAAVLEFYEDVTRFEKMVNKTMKNTMIIPSIIFVIFFLVLFLIVSKADRIINSQTKLLITIRKNMEKYISSSGVQAIYNAVYKKTELFTGKKGNIVVFFSDIRDFTSYSENTDPATIVKTLNSLFKLQSEIIENRYGGVIDKFVGDAVMATFPENNEGNAVNAAIKIQEKISKSNEIPLKIGIGIHSGEAVTGSIGSPNRMDYTSIGDSINIASRICSICPASKILISSSVFSGLNPRLNQYFLKSKELKVKGKEIPVRIHIFSRKVTRPEI